MALHLQNVGTMKAGNAFTWTSKDALLYALSVGAGASPEDLPFTTENSRGMDQQVLPTFTVVLGTGGGSSLADYGDFDLGQVLHGGQRITLHRDLGVDGSVVSRSGMTAAYDKGRNAIVETTTTFTDAQSGELVAEAVSSLVIRGEGGFGGDPGPAATWAPPERPADAVVSYQTRPDQALLYRLNGDRNPLHSDPAFARQVGFEQPILHGLCTYGFAGRALLAEAAGGDVSSFGSMSARFASPVTPGDVLEVHVWKRRSGADFQVWVGERVVLDHGTFSLRQG